MQFSRSSSEVAAYYRELADKLDELSDHARAKGTEGGDIGERLKTFAERIRADLEYRTHL